MKNICHQFHLLSTFYELFFLAFTLLYEYIFDCLFNMSTSFWVYLLAVIIQINC